MSFEPAYKYYTKEELYKLCEFDDEEGTAFRKKLVDAIFGSREIADKYREAFISERIAPIVKEMRDLPRHEIALMAISNSPSATWRRYWTRTVRTTQTMSNPKKATSPTAMKLLTAS